MNRRLKAVEKYLPPGPPGTWDEKSIIVIELMYNPSRRHWECWYEGKDNNNAKGIGFAYSDGQRTSLWTKYASNPVIDFSKPPIRNCRKGSWDDTYIGRPISPDLDNLMKKYNVPISSPISQP